MLDDVDERFLGDPIHDRARLALGLAFELVLEHELDAVVVLDLLHLHPQRSSETVAVEDRRSQLEHQMAQARDGQPRGALRLGEALEDGRVVCLAAEHLQAQRQRGQDLNRVVVDVCSDAPALFLLGPHELGEEAPPLFVALAKELERVEALGDVHHDPDRAAGAAVRSVRRGGGKADVQSRSITTESLYLVVGDDASVLDESPPRCKAFLAFRRNDGQQPAERLVGRPAELALGRCVPQRRATLEVDSRDRQGRRVQQRLQELVRIPKLCRRTLLLRDVGDDRHGRAHGPIRGIDGYRGQADIDPAPVAHERLCGYLAQRLAGEDAPAPGEELLQEIRRTGRQRLPENLFCRPTEHLLGRLVPHRHASLDVGDGDCERQAVEQRL